MRIAVIGAKGIPARQGGIEHYCQALYPAIVRSGISVDLFARQRYTQRLGKQQIQPDLRVISLPSVPVGSIDACVNALVATLICLFGHYDVVHFHALGPAVFSFIPRLFSRTTVVVTCHGLDWQRAKWDWFSRSFLRWGERIAVRFAHEFIVVSEPLQDYYWEHYRRTTRFIPTAPASYEASDPGFRYVRSLGLTVGRYVLFLGRIVPEKRPDLLLSAFQQLHPANYQLVFVGGTSDTQQFSQQLLAQSHGDERVLFTGELGGALLAEMVRGGGLFVLPSDVEGLPLVLLEAMREGIPVIASSIPPHQCLVAPNRGRLFIAGNLEALVDCLADALEDGVLSQSMAINARQYVENNYDWRQIAQEMAQVYNPSLQSETLPLSHPQP
jgi:glycosyltransferase involved in cell wall biosynthesis